VGIDLRESEFSDGGSLESAQERIGIQGTGSELFKELPPFLRRHGEMLPSRAGGTMKLCMGAKSILHHRGIERTKNERCEKG
jgi:hypothetical protein